MTDETGYAFAFGHFQVTAHTLFRVCADELWGDLTPVRSLEGVFVTLLTTGS